MATSRSMVVDCPGPSEPPLGAAMVLAILFTRFLRARGSVPRWALAYDRKVTN